MLKLGVSTRSGIVGVMFRTWIFLRRPRSMLKKCQSTVGAPGNLREEPLFCKRQ